MPYNAGEQRQAECRATEVIILFLLRSVDVALRITCMICIYLICIVMSLSNRPRSLPFSFILSIRPFVFSPVIHRAISGSPTRLTLRRLAKHN